MPSDFFMQYILPALIILPFFILWLGVWYWFYLIFSFRKRVKKIKPELAFKLPFFDPVRNFSLGFRIMYNQLSFGFLSKEKRDNILDELFNIKSIKKLNNNELNKYISKIEKFDKIYSHIFGFLMVTILGLAIIGWIFIGGHTGF